MQIKAKICAHRVHDETSALAIISRDKSLCNGKLLLRSTDLRSKNVRFYGYFQLKMLRFIQHLLNKTSFYFKYF